MKTTKELAELIGKEVELIAKGEVRKDVITGLERCSNTLIKLARLEMDFAWKNWENQQPNVPWLSTKARAAVVEEPEDEPEPEPEPSPTSNRIRDLEKQMDEVNDKLKANPSATMRKILNDKLTNLTISHSRAVAMSTEE